MANFSDIAKYKLNRRRFLSGTAAASASALLVPSIVQAQETVVLNIVSFPGRLQEPHQWLAKQLEAKHPGLKIQLVASESQDVVAQIKAAQGFSPFDAMSNGEPAHLTAMKDGYIQPARLGDLPNYGNALPSFTAVTQGYGVPVSYSLLGIACNESLLTSLPTSWGDLLSAEFSPKLGFPRPSSNLGLAAVVMIAKAFGGSEDDLEPGWAKLEEMKPLIASSPTQILQMLEREEIAVAPLWNNETGSAADKGLPIKFVQPDPGPVPVVSVMSEVTNSRYPELISEWMNGLLSPEYQTMAANSPYYFVPSTKDIVISDAAKPFMPSTPEEIARLQSIDWTKIAPKRAAILEEFDKRLAR